MGRGRGSAVEGRQRPGRSWDSARQSIHPSEVDVRSPGRPGGPAVRIERYSGMRRALLRSPPVSRCSGG